jgi:hypothetical protein
LYIYMSNQRLPNEDTQRVTDTEESVDLHSDPGLQEEEGEENAENALASNSEPNEEKPSSSSSNTDEEEAVLEESKLGDEGQQVTKQDTATKQEQVMPTMSPEQVLLLQVLRRAKRQQDLIIEVQKNLKSLTNIQKGIEKTTDQVKQLQSVVKDSQKQIIQIQRQISAVERVQEKEFAKLRMQKRGGALIPAKGRAAKNKGKRKKLR